MQCIANKKDGTQCRNEVKIILSLENEGYEDMYICNVHQKDWKTYAVKLDLENNNMEENMPEETLHPVYLAVTAHRPDKLPGGYQTAYHEGRNNLKKLLIEMIDKLQQSFNEHGFELVLIVGGALGGDTMMCDLARHLGIPYVVALPCKGFGRNWRSQKDKDKLQEHCRGASEEHAQLLATDGEEVKRGVVYTSDADFRTEYKHMDFVRATDKRNRWMVDHASEVFAIYNGDAKGGTANCVGYTRNQLTKRGVGLHLTIVHPETLIYQRLLTGHLEISED